ncbi:MAG: 2-C-methyl-D-erythritol 4-phosphate cytidylyltransferase [Oscillospiraceae bacterium]|nr:2-C-methyl-D-erythritol 4-phosphate cytidylyltransferase [Oscillospiraceae bacterium]
MGLNKSKQFIDLLGKPAVYYTLKAFENSVSVKEVIIVCRDCDKEEFLSIKGKYNFTKVKAIVNGGETRSISVKNGIMATDEKSTTVAIHDGARCLVTTEEIEKVVLSGISTGASALGVAVKDTIKIVNPDNTIKDTPHRSALRAIQTPQVFDKKNYLKFLSMAESDAADFTDDCKLFEYCGQNVTVVDGLYTNIKLTTQDDIIMAESILKGREQH